MSTIISILVTYNQLLLSQINELLIFIAKNIPLKAPKYDMTSPKYKKLTVDKLPIIKTFEHLDYKRLLNEYKIANGKDKKPVNPRGKNLVAPDTVCPRCGAPHNYIYDNAGGRGQLCCKVCDLHFSKNKVDFKTALFICPYCGHALSKKKNRKNFYVHKCVNKKCDFYLNYLAADETYTKIKGQTQYIWLVMDAIKKSILGYQASFTRDTGPCILTMRMAFDKFKEFPGKPL